VKVDAAPAPLYPHPCYTTQITQLKFNITFWSINVSRGQLSPRALM